MCTALLEQQEKEETKESLLFFSHLSPPYPLCPRTVPATPCNANGTTRHVWWAFQRGRIFVPAVPGAVDAAFAFAGNELYLTPPDTLMPCAARRVCPAPQERGGEWSEVRQP